MSNLEGKASQIAGSSGLDDSDSMMRQRIGNTSSMNGGSAGMKNIGGSSTQKRSK